MTQEYNGAAARADSPADGRMTAVRRAQPAATSLIEHADALDWLQRQEPGAARAIIVDPPYSRGGPMRGRPDGMAGQVAGPWKFMHQALSLCARAVMPRGIVICFGDFELLPDLEYLCSIAGLREQAHLTWTRSRPGGGWLFRLACDPVLIASPLSPDRVDASAVRNWFAADCEIPRVHPYSKPPGLIEYILARVCRKGDLILDPFAGSGSSRTAAQSMDLGLVWKGCDIDPQFAEVGAAPPQPACRWCGSPLELAWPPGDTWDCELCGGTHGSPYPYRCTGCGGVASRWFCIHGNEFDDRLDEFAELGICKRCWCVREAS